MSTTSLTPQILRAAAWNGLITLDPNDDPTVAITDHAWQWAHGSAIAVASIAAFHLKANREVSAIGWTVYSIPLAGGGLLCFAADESFDGDPVPAITWTIYTSDGDDGETKHGAWIGDVEYRSPAAEPAIGKINDALEQAGGRA